MKHYCDTKVNYCSYLKRNVVFVYEADRDGDSRKWDCMNKSECEYDKFGCQNQVIGNFNRKCGHICDSCKPNVEI